jgi:hypothetical protein
MTHTIGIDSRIWGKHRATFFGKCSNIREHVLSIFSLRVLIKYPDAGLNVASGEKCLAHEYSEPEAGED